MELSTDIFRFSYLWNAEFTNHVLVRMGDTGDEAQDFLIFDKVLRMVTKIDDARIKRAVCKEMLRQGCSIVEDFGPL